MFHSCPISLILAASFSISWHLSNGFRFSEFSERKVKSSRDVPDFMWDIYQNGVNSSEIDLVRSIFPKSFGTTLKSNSYRNHKKREIQFVIPEFKESEEIFVKAELILFTHGIKNCGSNFQIYFKSNEWIFLDEKKFSNFRRKWISLEATFGVENSRSGCIKFLLLTLCLGGTKKMRDDGFFRPVLVLFYLTRSRRQDKENPDSRSARPKRSLGMEDYEEETNRLWKDEDSVKKLLGSKSPGVWKNSCSKKPLHIEFSEIDYDSWIVAPSGYEAFQCSGKCMFPVSEHLSPTKHAILQTLLHQKSPSKAPRACCVPTKLEPISILYVDENGVLTYRFRYHDMVVAECGCR